MRQLLTSIYQRHCAVVGENEADGLQRFGKALRSWILSGFA